MNARHKDRDAEGLEVTFPLPRAAHTGHRDTWRGAHEAGLPRFWQAAVEWTGTLRRPRDGIGSVLSEQRRGGPVRARGVRV